MIPALAFDADLLRRYDRPGPRYTSYPTAPQFSADFGEDALRRAIQDSNGDPIPRRLSMCRSASAPASIAAATG